MSDEKKVAALREEIRQAGAFTRSVRVYTAAWLAGVPIALLLILAALFLYGPVLTDDGEWHFSAWIGPWLGVLAVAAMISAGAYVVAVVAAWCQRCYCRADLRERVAALDAPARVELLLDLRSEGLGDTRKIAASFLREFGVRSEVVPATAREGRGDEVAER